MNQQETINHLGLFEGIGGFSLAAKLMGWKTLAWCEWNTFCQTILRYHFPEAEGFGDITKSDFKKYANQIDVLTGGFPCQPFSLAGNRSGVKDDRYLWPEMLRVIRETKPRIIVAENVSGLFTILEPESLSEVESQEIQFYSQDESYEINETIRSVQRRVIATIIQEIRNEGYILPELEDGTPVVCCIPACSFNAPHRRDRIWIVAYSSSNGYERRRFEKDRPEEGKSQKIQNKRKWIWPNTIRNGSKKFIANSKSNRYDWCKGKKCSGTKWQIFSGKCSGHTMGSKIKRYCREWATPNANSSNGFNLCRYEPCEWSKIKKKSIFSYFVSNGYVTNSSCRNYWYGFKKSNLRQKQQFGELFEQKNITYSHCNRRKALQFKIQGKQSERNKFNANYKQIDWTKFPTQSPVCSGDDGIPSKLDGITFSKWRAQSIMAYGNAIVPQVAVSIFKTLRL